MRHLHQETRDGLVLEGMLEANPRLAERREAYFARIAANRQTLAPLDRDVIEQAAYAMRLFTVPGYAERMDRADLEQRVAICMDTNLRHEWLEALGLAEPRNAVPMP
jgi:hypothetical protein